MAKDVASVNQGQQDQLPAAPGREWWNGFIKLSYAISAYRESVEFVMVKYKLKKGQPLPDDWWIMICSKPNLDANSFALRDADYKSRDHIPGISGTVVFGNKSHRDTAITLMRNRPPEARDHLHFAQVGEIQRVSNGAATVIFSPTGGENLEPNGNKLHVLIVPADPVTGKVVGGELAPDVRQALPGVFQHESTRWAPTVCDVLRRKTGRRS